MNTTIIYHKACMDGLGACYAAWLKFKNEAEYIPCQYGETVSEEKLQGRDVFILDFSFKPEVLKRMSEIANSVKVIDHHATAKKDLECFCHPNFSKIFDMEMSGAMLSWLHFHGDENIPKLIRFIQDRDLWVFDYEHTKLVHAWMKSRPYTMDNFHEAVSLVESPDGFEVVCSIGRALEALQNSMIHSCIKTHRVMDMKHGNSLMEVLRIPVFNCAGGLISDAVSKFLEENTDYQIAAAYFDTDTDRVFSLRSVPGVDCTPIARFYGGGGHPQACGFRVPRSHYLAQS